MNLVTIAAAAEATGKSPRSIWRYVRALEYQGRTVTYRMPGIASTLVDLDVVAPVALTQRRGNPRHHR